MKKLISALLVSMLLIPSLAFSWDRGYHSHWDQGYHSHWEPRRTYVYRDYSHYNDGAWVLGGVILGTAILGGIIAAEVNREPARPVYRDLCSLGYEDGLRRLSAASSDFRYLDCYREGLNRSR